MMAIESVAGLPVRIDARSKSADGIRAAIETVTALMRVDRVETDFTRHGGAGIVYHLADPSVTVIANAFVEPSRIQAAIAKERRRIDRHEAERAGPRTIDAADAHLASALRCWGAVRQLSRTALRPARISMWHGMGHGFQTDGESVKIDDQLIVHLRGSRVSIARATPDETWSQGTLVTGRRLQLPDTVLGSIKGRRLDEVVQGGMLAGAGLIVRNAWMNGGGRLGLSFEPHPIPLDEALAAASGTRPAARLAA